MTAGLHNPGMVAEIDPKAPQVQPSTAAPRRLLDQVRDVIRVRHYSLRTEQTYVQWIRCFILFHGKRHPREMGEPEIVSFLTDLAVRARVSASTQNQAFNALLFLYKTGGAEVSPSGITDAPLYFRLVIRAGSFQPTAPRVRVSPFLLLKSALAPNLLGGEPFHCQSSLGSNSAAHSRLPEIPKSANLGTGSKLDFSKCSASFANYDTSWHFLPDAGGIAVILWPRRRAGAIFSANFG